MQKQFISALFLLLLLPGCDNAHQEVSTHNHSNGLEHDHSGDDEHVDRSRHLIHFSNQGELFLQYEPLIVNRDSVFLAHFTRLSDYIPPPDGFITITLSGDGVPDEIFSGKRPVRDGIHIEVVTPQHPAKRQLTVQIQSPTLTTTHHLGNVTVYPTLTTSKLAAPQHWPDNTLYLSKETQWQANFLIQKPIHNDQQTLSLPLTAIHHVAGDQFIYVMKTAEFFEQRPVTTGALHHGQIGIVKGVSVNERVVTRGAEIFLTDQAEVEEMTEHSHSDHH